MAPAADSSAERSVRPQLSTFAFRSSRRNARERQQYVPARAWPPGDVSRCTWQAPRIGVASLQGRTHLGLSCWTGVLPYTGGRIRPAAWVRRPVGARGFRAAWVRRLSAAAAGRGPAGLLAGKRRHPLVGDRRHPLVGDRRHHLAGDRRHTAEVGGLDVTGGVTGVPGEFGWAVVDWVAVVVVPVGDILGCSAALNCCTGVCCAFAVMLKIKHGEPNIINLNTMRLMMVFPRGYGLTVRTPQKSLVHHKGL